MEGWGGREGEGGIDGGWGGREGGREMIEETVQ